MFNNDYNKQYERRQRIKKMTLVVGIDIGADFNALGFRNPLEIVLLTTYISGATLNSG